ncbi:type II secretion system F family protein [Saxibacter everestensis]|uniref:Type II secretion system F family protein n=1 Tax=Saxibacter everestensis TaxID=2909229 RepID=A0ABY8QUG3_9MICO|nr:type II secretion system F family protein [Brevibacteriaceae bacterium ZFBP1038]
MSGIGWTVPAAVGAGAFVGIALFLLILALVGWPRRDMSKPSLFRRVTGGRSASSRLVWAVVSGVAVLALTGWIVAAVGIGLLVGYWDRLVGSAKQEQLAVMRLEALATWTESLRDTIAGAVGLEQAIPASVAATPPVIRPQLNLLVDRLRIREPLPSALQSYADDLNDPGADMIVAALILNARLRGPGLRDVLSSLAVSTREELDMRRRIDASRAGIRRSVRIVIVIVLGVMGGLAVFNKSYVEPFGDFTGQLVLLMVALLIFGGLYWLRRLADPERRERFLVRGKESAAEPDPGSTSARPGNRSDARTRS